MKYGKVCLSLSGYRYYNGFFPFINMWKSGNDGIILNVDADGPSGGGGVADWTSSTAPGAATSPWGVFLDPDTGELVSPLPQSPTGPRLSGFSRVVSEVFADFAGETWLLKFDGTASNVQITGMSNVSRVGNRITSTWDAASLKNIRFISLDENDPPRNIVFCRADLESLHDAGEIWRPDYLEQIARMGGVIRGMDAFCPTNHNWTNATFAKFPSESYYSWGGSTPKSWSLHGTPHSVIKKLHDKINSPIWYNVPHVLGCGKVGVPTALSKANPCVVTDYGHTFADGETIILAQTGGATMSRTATVTISNSTDLVSSSFTPQMGDGVFFTVSGGSIGSLVSGRLYYISANSYTADTSFKLAAYRGGPDLDLTGTFSGTITMEHRPEGQRFTVANSVANVSYELSGFDTSAYGGEFSGYSFIPPTLANVATEVGLLAAYFRDNITTNQTWWQLSNETWLSSIFSQYRFYYTIMGDIPSATIGGDQNRCYGYWAAAFMDAIRQTYGDRTKWRGVFAPWTAIPDTGTKIIEGINLYISLNAPTLTITDLFDHYAITGYIGATLMTAANSSTIMGWITTSQSRYDSGIEATKYDYFTRLLSEQITDGRHITPYTQSADYIATNTWPQHQTISGNAGLTMVQYEGGYHTYPNDGMYAVLSTDDKALLMEFFTAASHTQEVETALEYMRQLWVTDIGAEYPSQFVDFNGVSIYGAFGACTSQYDTENPRARGLKKFNGLKVVARPVAP